MREYPSPSVLTMPFSWTWTRRSVVDADTKTMWRQRFQRAGQEQGANGLPLDGTSIAMNVRSPRKILGLKLPIYRGRFKYPFRARALRYRRFARTRPSCNLLSGTRGVSWNPQRRRGIEQFSHN